MGTSKVVIRRTAKRKDGNAKGTVVTSTTVKVTPKKVTTRKVRAMRYPSGGEDVGYLKSG